MPFHIVGLKCIHCGSYNTCNDSEPTDDAAAAESVDAEESRDEATDTDDKT